MKKFLLLVVITMSFITCTQSQIPFPSDIYKTGKGELRITVLGHASLLFHYEGKTIYVDPYFAVVDYSRLPKADLILITHEHPDHLDVSAINLIKNDKTQFITSQVVKETLGYGESISNGDKTTYVQIPIEAVPAYNIVNKRPDGEYYHPKGRGNGYVLTFDNLKIYIAGDTENIPEMENLKGKIDIAFLPKNLPYTMSDDMFVDAVKKVESKIIYPYHFSEFDESKIKEALKGVKTTLLIRPMKNK